MLAQDGSELGRVDLPSKMTSWVASPLIDLANRLVYLWQPGDHVVSRVDLDGRNVDQLQVDPLITNGPPNAPMVRPGSWLQPNWATFSSDMRLAYRPQLLAEPGWGRFFALGIRQEAGNTQADYQSSGIWVIDARDLTLLDHWAPLAAYESIGLSGDGRWLLAAAIPGVDEAGNAANWQSSITVYDVSDGRPALQFGRLGTAIQVFQVPP